MTDYHYFLRGLVYFLAAFLPSLGASLAAAQPVFLALVIAFGAGAVAVASYMDKTSGKRDCDVPSSSSVSTTSDNQ